MDEDKRVERYVPELDHTESMTEEVSWSTSPSRRGRTQGPVVCNKSHASDRSELKHDLDKRRSSTHREGSCQTRTIHPSSSASNEWYKMFTERLLHENLLSRETRPADSTRRSESFSKEQSYEAEHISANHPRTAQTQMTRPTSRNSRSRHEQHALHRRSPHPVDTNLSMLSSFNKSRDYSQAYSNDVADRGRPHSCNRSGANAARANSVCQRGDSCGSRVDVRSRDRSFVSQDDHLAEHYADSRIARQLQQGCGSLAVKFDDDQFDRRLLQRSYGFNERRHPITELYDDVNCCEPGHHGRTNYHEQQPIHHEVDINWRQTSLPIPSFGEGAMDAFDLQLLEQARAEEDKNKQEEKRQDHPAGQPGIRMVDVGDRFPRLHGHAEQDLNSPSSRQRLPAVEIPELGQNAFLLRPSLLREEEEFNPYKRPYTIL